MPRPLRIEFPGAFYHVYSRGNQKQSIFFSDADRYYFIKILRESCERFDLRVHLYCLMPNHYHLFLETPEANLSEIMHFVNTAFTVYLNKKHERCGHLFQGRFKAILVQTDVYAKRLTTYLHGNPVRKKITARPEHFPWSSCQDYYGIRKPPSWLNTSVIMELFQNSREALIKEHEQDILLSDVSPIEICLKEASRIGVLGDDDFVDRIRRVYLKKQMENPDPELREVRRLIVKPELSEIASRINEELGPRNRLAKRCIVYFAHRYAAYKLREIGAYLGIGPGAVSASYRKIVKEMAFNQTLSRVIDRLRTSLRDDGIISGASQN
jgi:putative transposase